ncbi:MAG: alpha/beta fold hydrolase [Tatlockia sp.]
MNPDDFRCMRRGKHIKTLDKQTSTQLYPIHYQDGKRKRALLLLHGFSSTPAVFRLFLPTLCTLYNAVICPALPGHAKNIEAFSKATKDNWIAKSEAVCSELMNSYEQVDVMGLSLGGVLACHLSATFSLNHLYLLAPALHLKLPVAPVLRMTKILSWLGFSTFRSSAGDLQTVKHCEFAYRQLPLATIIEVLTFIKGFKLNPPTCPTDLFLGRHDRVVDSLQVAARFQDNPAVTLHWLNHSAHVLPLDDDGDAILKVIQLHR